MFLSPALRSGRILFLFITFVNVCLSVCCSLIKVKKLWISVHELLGMIGLEEEEDFALLTRSNARELIPFTVCTDEPRRPYGRPH